MQKGSNRKKQLRRRDVEQGFQGFLYRMAQGETTPTLGRHNHGNVGLGIWDEYSTACPTKLRLALTINNGCDCDGGR
jgi:hypothetical protein